MSILVLLVVVMVLVAVVAIAVAVAVAASRRPPWEHQVGGVPSSAPTAWAGGHSPEALLHQRLRDAVAALPPPDRAELFEATTSIRNLALTVDERLVSVAKLPERHRYQPLADVAAAVDTVETAVAAVVDARHRLAPRPPDLERQLQALNERVAMLDQARDELGDDGPAAPR